MNQQAKQAAEACAADSDRNAPFPEIVTRLMAAGFERYHTDLRRGEKTFYMPDGASHVVACEPVPTPFAESFSAEDVRDAVRAIQRHEINYKEFCARIARAGCVGYLVSFPGQRALYYGRTGDNYVEMFPRGN
jgi:uncharacterized protein YbcV (DUF1398 family)